MSNEHPQLPSRRRMLGLLGGFGAAVVAGCGDDGATTAAPTTTTGTATATSTTAGAPSTTAGATSTTTAAAVTSCTKIPAETAGPYPGDGTNGPNVLTQSGVVRSDIRSSIATASGVATGVPLTIKLDVVDSKNGCTALAGAAVYLWHCDMSGLYSMYSPGVTAENYLRGVQATDANGSATFVSIFPGAYSGRWPHIHFEVFPSLASATNGQNKTLVSQLALPDDVCKAAYATTGYSQSVTNHARTSLTNDNVFRDGVTLQMPTVTGSATAGYVATLLVAV
ncbi:MAG TPA: intradiol ring-cleavage dioxygenase [Acidimicrobiales bacterium]|nr:intradiol ring-cleavage dioxygenase [Acidimicrobiales bacterium]